MLVRELYKSVRLTVFGETVVGLHLHYAPVYELQLTSKAVFRCLIAEVESVVPMEKKALLPQFYEDIRSIKSLVESVTDDDAGNLDIEEAVVRAGIMPPGFFEAILRGLGLVNQLDAREDFNTGDESLKAKYAVAAGVGEELIRAWQSAAAKDTAQARAVSVALIVAAVATRAPEGAEAELQAKADQLAVKQAEFAAKKEALAIARRERQLKREELEMELAEAKMELEMELAEAEMELAYAQQEEELKKMIAGPSPTLAPKLAHALTPLTQHSGRQSARNRRRLSWPSKLKDTEQPSA